VLAINTLCDITTFLRRDPSQLQLLFSPLLSTWYCVCFFPRYILTWHYGRISDKLHYFVTTRASFLLRVVKVDDYEISPLSVLQKVFISYCKRRRADVLLVITLQTTPTAKRTRHWIQQVPALALRCPVDVSPVGEARDWWPLLRSINRCLVTIHRTRLSEAFFFILRIL
jgi:hypothetical protein